MDEETYLDLFNRDEDISDNTADELFEMQREDKKLLRDQWAKLDTANNIRETERLKK